VILWSWEFFVFAADAGLILNTIFLVREVKSNDATTAFLNAVTP